MPQTLAELMTGHGLAPREATFAAPWEARAFALAMALTERGAFAWEEFRQRLIAQIAAADQAAAAGQSTPAYYECWITALEASLMAGRLVDAAELERCAAHIAAHPVTPNRATSPGPIKIA